MKEVVSPEVKAPSEFVTIAEQRSEKKKIGSIQPYPGHTTFKLDLSHPGLLVSEIEEQDMEVIHQFNGGVTRKIVIKEGFLYCSALNKKNAIKRFSAMLSQRYRFTQQQADAIQDTEAQTQA
jgi:hypothetical protein